MEHYVAPSAGRARRGASREDNLDRSEPCKATVGGLRHVLREDGDKSARINHLLNMRKILSRARAADLAGMGDE